MTAKPSLEKIFHRQQLMVFLGLLLAAGFMAVSLASYVASRNALRAAIVDQELPLTSDNIYTEIQKDLVRPIFISSMMASDTFLRDWVLRGEKDVAEMTRYLKEVQERYNTFTSFFISDKSSLYYQSQGILKKVSEKDPHDGWYYQVRDMADPYRIDVDTDQANGDRLTIFINYRVFDYQQRFIGAAGVGLTVDAVRRYLVDYQQRFQRNVYFVEPKGKIALFGNNAGHQFTDIHAVQGLGTQADAILASKSGSYRYRNDGHDVLLNVRFIPELNWYLFVEKQEDEAMAGIRHVLYFNLALCALITALVLIVLRLALNRYQGRLEAMAVIDKLTGLYNRQAFDLLVQQTLADLARHPQPVSLLLMDLDHFKEVNDNFGHLQGDCILQQLSPVLRHVLRQSDLVFRWGGEEFLVLLRGSDSLAATGVAEKLRAGLSEHRFDLSTPGQPLHHSITLSIGVAELQPGENLDSLVSRADRALYQAKSNGRNRVVLAPQEGPAGLSSQH